MAPAFGTTLDSAALVDMFAAFPGWFATSLKGAVAAAGSYHTLNGLRHLSWDMGYCESPVPTGNARVRPRGGGPFRANPANSARRST
jgi:succinate dehydrogenase/fumarate reductase cytochrome b subunit